MGLSHFQLTTLTFYKTTSYKYKQKWEHIFPYNFTLSIFLKLKIDRLSWACRERDLMENCKNNLVTLNICKKPHTDCVLCVCVCVSVHTCAHSVVPHSLQPHGLWSIRLLCPWNFPGKNTGVGCHFLLPGIFPT